MAKRRPLNEMQSPPVFETMTPHVQRGFTTTRITAMARRLTVAAWLAGTWAGAAMGQETLPDEDPAAEAAPDATDFADDSEAQDNALFSASFLRTNLRLSTDRGLEFATDDDTFRFRAGGRMLIDGVRFAPDQNDLGDDRIELRDGRLDLYATAYEDWQGRVGAGVLTADFSRVQFDLRSLHLTYTGFKPLVFRLGQQSEVFSLEEMTGFRAITFMERSLANAFAPGSNAGFSARTHGKRWTAALGFFADDLFSDKDQGDQGRGVTGRITGLPYAIGDAGLHLGLSASWRRTDVDNNVRFRTRPETRLTDVRLVDTGTIRNAESITRVGLEAAWVNGPFSVQGEYMVARVRRTASADGLTSGGSLTFDGWYVFASWFPFGGERRYLYDVGEFGQVQPDDMWSGIELAARYSAISLTDGPIRGGRENNITLGVNWHVNRQVRVMANYIKVNTDADASDGRTIIGNDNPNIFLMRLELSI